MMKKLKYQILILVLVLASLFSSAQITPDTLWTRTYGGTSNEDAISVIQTVDSCFVILGHALSAGFNDIWLMKIDGKGDMLWEKTFGGTSGDYGVMVKQTTDRGFIIAGTTESYGQGDRNIWLIKTDESGSEQWNKVFDNTIDNTSQAQNVSQTSDGGYVITGSTGNHILNHLDSWLIKVDENGDEEWNKKIGGSGNQKTYSVFQLDDGGYILSGNSMTDDNMGDMWLFKTDENGNMLWEKTFGGSQWDNAYSMQITADSGYILAGYTKSAGNGEEDLWLIKTDSQGNEIWNKIYGESMVDYVYSIQITEDGGFVTGGFSNSSGTGNFDFWLFKTDSNGNREWSKTIGGNRDDFAFSVAQTFDGGYVMAGRTNSFGNGGNDAYIVRFKSDSFDNSSLVYLGQTPPGVIPERFPPDYLLANEEWSWHGSPVFSPNGDEMFFVKFYSDQFHMEMNYMKVVENEWTYPATPSFVLSQYNDNCPILSITGDTLYFRSNRPGGYFFMTTRYNEEWSDPVALQIPIPAESIIGWQFAITKNNDVYFRILNDIYCAKFINGEYQTPEMLSDAINTDYNEFSPYVDPDDNYILFSSNKPGGYGFNDIYFSKRDINGNWTRAVNLGREINTSSEEAGAIISYDNLYLFYTTQQSSDTDYNSYWVDIRALDSFYIDVAEIKNNKLNFRNFPNPYNNSTT
ncbi:hypothetical protein ACFLTI_10390, partial [Bacteroidota bacterium]